MPGMQDTPAVQHSSRPARAWRSSGRERESEPTGEVEPVVEPPNRTYTLEDQQWHAQGLHINDNDE